MFIASGLGFIAPVCMGALTESLVKEATTYGGNKKLTFNNVQKLLDTAGINTAIQTSIGLATGKVADKIVKINSEWIKPQKNCY